MLFYFSLAGIFEIFRCKQKKYSRLLIFPGGTYDEGNVPEMTSQKMCSPFIFNTLDGKNSLDKSIVESRMESFTSFSSIC